MAAENGNRAASKTNNTNLENTHRESTTHAPIRGKMERTMVETQRNVRTKPTKLESQENMEQYLYCQQGGKSDEASKKYYCAKKKRSRENNIFHTRNNKQ